MVLFCDLKLGDKVRLVDFGGTPTTYRCQLLSLGLTVGTEITVVRVAPLGCPIQIDVRGSSFALRKHEAAQLIWQY